MSLTDRLVKQQHALIIPDGAADLHGAPEATPLALAHTPYMDQLARQGVTGLMQTLYADLPRESVVAQLGMLGWDPHTYYPNGRASCELLATEEMELGVGDLAFRGNLARLVAGRLQSYSADNIASDLARPLVERLNAELGARFPNWTLYHNEDFRSTLVVRGARLDPAELNCPEPHECHGLRLNLQNLASGTTPRAQIFADQLNSFTLASQVILQGERANVLLPWSPSGPFGLPPFASHTGMDGRVAIVGAMDFLQGIARAGQMEFFKVGDGTPRTDYQAKGEKIFELLTAGYDLVICHVNGADEASHGGDIALKRWCLEQVDRWIVRRVAEYFGRADKIGSICVAPDHYSNCSQPPGGRRVQAHSMHPVPFLLWNGKDRDPVPAFSEHLAAEGRYGRFPVNHLELLDLIGAVRRSRVRIPQPG